VYYRLVQYPGAGFGGFYDQIRSAKRSIDLEVYELEDPVAERELASAAGRGVEVRVLLDKDFSGARANQPAFDYLRAHHVQVRWAPAGYIFHIKTTTFDRRSSDISTANLTARYYGGTRDAEVIDTNPAQVRAIEATFANDWRAGPSGVPAAQTVQAPGLIWSPNTGSSSAETALVAQIERARRSIDFESEELADPAIYDALARAAERGAVCRIVMTNSSEWDAAFAEVARAGCRVRLFGDSSSTLYIHEKLILDDRGTANQSLLVGSQNASVTSLTRNRELSIRVSDGHGGRAVIGAAASTFDSDFGRASPWTTTSGSSTRSHLSAGASDRSSGAGGSAPSGGACHPLSSSGNCYSSGEYCSQADHGIAGVARDGGVIVCTEDHGWRWESK
jgi:phosphatidylserine/phosphatidylglycerophosphate/cardiolipin synthase-like enzyme